MKTLLNILRSKTIAISVAIGLVCNVVVSATLSENSLLAFRLSSLVHLWQYRVNDLLHLPDILLQPKLDESLEEFSVKEVIDFLIRKWEYTSDLENWDVANPPVKSFLEQKGDCDDFARLSSYILHKKGFETYFIMLISSSSGHATTVYYDHKKSTLNLVDVSGMWVTVPVIDFVAEHHVPRFIQFLFADSTFIDVRTWDISRSIISINTKEIFTDEDFSWPTGN